MCEELKIGCTMQMRRFETLIPALNENRGDAVIASIARPPEIRAKVDFTDPYYRSPARFVARRDSSIEDCVPEKLEGKKVAVVGGTAHEAYLKALFTEAELRAYPNSDAGAAGAAARRRRSAVRRRHRARVLAQRHQFGELLRVSRRALSRQPLFRRRHRHRRAQGQRHDAAGAELGAVPGLGAGPLHRPVAALFPDQPVLRL